MLRQKVTPVVEAQQELGKKVAQRRVVSKGKFPVSVVGDYVVAARFTRSGATPKLVTVATWTGP